jgi:hypothetical protein
LSKKIGVAFGPGPWASVAFSIVNGAGYPPCHSCLPLAASNAVIVSFSPMREN